MGSTVVEIVKVRGRTGTTSIEITLPKAFVRELGLKAGHHVSVELMPDSSLRLRRVKS
jgi:antitoxin component of MazEF toxin-antitoxin module